MGCGYERTPDACFLTHNNVCTKVLCDTIPASFSRFYRKIALLFSSKNDKNLHENLSQMF